MTKNRKALADATRRAAADPYRVKTFFDQFKREVGAQAPAAARQTGAWQPGQRTYTAQIAALYEAHRKGEFANRESEWARIEQDFFAAQKEGRVIDHAYITK
jgi:hypothetical protein